MDILLAVLLADGDGDDDLGDDDDDLGDDDDDLGDDDDGQDGDMDMMNNYDQNQR